MSQTPTPQPRALPATWVWSVLVLGGLMGIWAWGAWRAAQRVQLLADLQYADAYPATDWVHWKDDSLGIVAHEVLPPAARNPRLGARYVLPGDRLLRIDYAQLYQAETAQRISRQVPSGTVLLYQLERAGSPDRIQQFVVAAYRPPGWPTEHSKSFWGYLVLALAGVLAVGVLLAVVVPFFRSGVSGSGPTLALLAAILLVFGIQLGRGVLVLFDSDYRFLHLEKAALVAWFVTWGAALALWSWQLAWPRVWRLGLVAWLMLLTIAWAWLVYGYGYVGLVAPYSLAVLAMLHLGVLWVYSFQVSMPVSGWRWAWVGLRLGVGWVLGVLTVSFVAGEIWLFQHPGIQLVLLASWALPLALTSQTALRFGDVSDVVGRGLLGLLAVLAVLAAYVLVFRWLEGLLPDAAWRAVVVLVGLVLAGLGGRLLLRRWALRLSNWFASGRKRREGAFYAFLERLPRYTHSAQLITDLRDQLIIFYQSPTVLLWLEGEPVETFRTQLPQAESIAGSKASPQSDWLALLPALHQALSPEGHANERYWVRSREISPTSLPGPLQTQAEAYGLQVVMPFVLNKGERGLLVLGGRAKGVFSLADVGLLQRTVQQTRLTLDILRLLETERDLIEKTLQANLTALRSQINPHFLFNALNTISSLIHDSPELAEAGVVKLGDIFRYTLKFSKENFVTVQNEMSLVQNYLAIEKLRFGDRLTVEIQVAPESLEHQLPAFVIQTLVENTIKHGISKIIEPGQVRIQIRVEDDLLVAEVYDNGPGINPERIRKGDGLNNVLDRLQRLYNRSDLLSFQPMNPGTSARLQIPLSTHIRSDNA